LALLSWWDDRQERKTIEERERLLKEEAEIQMKNEAKIEERRIETQQLVAEEVRKVVEGNPEGVCSNSTEMRRCCSLALTILLLPFCSGEGECCGRC